MKSPLAATQTSGPGLVLGYDGGCKPCAELAGRIQEVSEGKISLRNLHDPEVRGWRERALGDDAPWAPTLFKVDDGRVRAWIGVGMAVRLGLALGWARTWRTLRVLGEHEWEPTVAEPRAGVRFSRGRFLRTAAGGAALSALSGVALFPASASALTNEEKRRIATTVVKNSAQYKKLASMQADIGATFKWSTAKVRVYKDGALVKVNSESPTRTIATLFGANTRKRRVFWHRHQMVIPTSATRTQYLSYEKGKPLANFHQTAREGDPAMVKQDDPVRISDGRTVTVAELREEAQARNASLYVSDHNEPANACERCVAQEDHDCHQSIGLASLFDPTNIITLGTVFTGLDEQYCETYAHDSMATTCSGPCGTASTGGGHC